ncbi:MAG: hypothetical protein ACREM6_15125 [Vulcanimicrobiaceae bacterium]
MTTVQAGLLAFAGLAVAFAGPQSARAQTPPAPAPTTAPSALESPQSAPPPAAPQPVPSPAAASPAPSAAAPAALGPTPAYRFIYTPPPAPSPLPDSALPRILEVDLSDQTIVTPELVRLRVLTTPEVTTVVLSALGRTIPLPQVAPGQFSAEEQVPQPPASWRNRTYRIAVVATMADGRHDSVEIPILLR